MFPYVYGKSGKTLISYKIGKIPYFRVFTLFGDMIVDYILNFSRLTFQWETSHFMYFVLNTLFQALYLEINPLKPTLGA